MDISYSDQMSYGIIRYQWMPTCFFHLPNSAPAIFSTRRGLLRKKQLQAPYPLPIARSDCTREIKAKADRLCEEYPDIIARVKIPTRWEDLYEYFDGLDIYTDGPYFLYHVLSKIAEDTEVRRKEVTEQCRKEIDDWALEWVNSNEAVVLSYGSNTDLTKLFDAPTLGFMKELKNYEWNWLRDTLSRHHFSLMQRKNTERSLRPWTGVPSVLQVITSHPFKAHGASVANGNNIHAGSLDIASQSQRNPSIGMLSNYAPGLPRYASNEYHGNGPYCFPSDARLHPDTCRQYSGQYSITRRDSTAYRKQSVGVHRTPSEARNQPDTPCSMHLNQTQVSSLYGRSKGYKGVSKHARAAQNLEEIQTTTGSSNQNRKFESSCRLSPLFPNDEQAREGDGWVQYCYSGPFLRPIPQDLVVYVAGVDKEVFTSHELKQLMETCGEVDSIRMLTNNSYWGRGFVSYQRRESLQAAVHMLSGVSTSTGTCLRVEFSRKGGRPRSGSSQSYGEYDRYRPRGNYYSNDTTGNRHRSQTLGYNRSEESDLLNRFGKPSRLPPILSKDQVVSIADTMKQQAALGKKALQGLSNYSNTPKCKSNTTKCKSRFASSGMQQKENSPYEKCNSIRDTPHKPENHQALENKLLKPTKSDNSKSKATRSQQLVKTGANGSPVKWRKENQSAASSCSSSDEPLIMLARAKDKASTLQAMREEVKAQVSTELSLESHQHWPPLGRSATSVISLATNEGDCIDQSLRKTPTTPLSFSHLMGDGSIAYRLKDKASGQHVEGISACYTLSDATNQSKSDEVTINQVSNCELSHLEPMGTAKPEVQSKISAKKKSKKTKKKSQAQKELDEGSLASPVIQKSESFKQSQSRSPSRGPKSHETTFSINLDTNLAKTKSNTSFGDNTRQDASTAECPTGPMKQKARLCGDNRDNCVTTVKEKEHHSPQLFQPAFDTADNLVDHSFSSNTISETNNWSNALISNEHAKTCTLDNDTVVKREIYVSNARGTQSSKGPTMQVTKSANEVTTAERFVNKVQDSSQNEAKKSSQTSDHSDRPVRIAEILESTMTLEPKAQVVTNSSEKSTTQAGTVHKNNGFSKITKKQFRNVTSWIVAAQQPLASLATDEWAVFTPAITSPADITDGKPEAVYNVMSLSLRNGFNSKLRRMSNRGLGGKEYPFVKRYRSIKSWHRA